MFMLHAGLGTRLDLRTVPRLHPPRSPLAGWAERSQQRACRNAMAASTALAEHRRERDEVAAYVETVIAHRSGAPTPAAHRTSALG